MPRLDGVGASPGAAVGPALVLPEAVAVADASSVASPDEEAARVSAALEGTADELDRRAAAADGETAEIVAVQATMARDPELRAAVLELVAGGQVPGAHALEQAAEGYAAALEASGDEYLAARAADVRDVAARAARRLEGVAGPDLAALASPVVIVARDIAPADLVGVDGRLVLGLATEAGSRTSHTAIVARTLGVPAVVAVEGLLCEVADGQEIGVDGDAGAIVVGPDERERDVLERRGAARRAARVAAAEGGPLRLRDGTEIELAANVGSLAELRQARAAGAQAVGLLRTELLYLERSTPPDEREQVELYGAMADLLAGGRLVIRTFDFGADKPVPFLDERPGPNPALGVRGIRLARRHPELLEAQVAAVVRAARGGSGRRVALMAPMVATVEEARWFRSLVESGGGLEAGLEVGVMVEVPSAVLVAPELAAGLDFLSIGTNDLTQYLHAADRQEGALAALQDPHAPAVLRAVRAICDAGTRGGAWVGVCGEAAGLPDWAVVAVGLGVRELSMGAGALADVRAALAERTLDDCRAAAASALGYPFGGGTPRAASSQTTGEENP